MSEQWAPIPSFPGYEASTFGRVRSVNRLDAMGRRRAGKVLDNARRPSHRKTGGSYLRLRLRKDGRTHDIAVHWLVLEAFVGPRPEGMHGCHNDGDANNNALSNLRWDTPSRNQMDKVQHGTMAHGSRNGWAKLTEDQVRRIWESPLSAPILAERMGVNRESIARIRRGELWAWFTGKLPPRSAQLVTRRSRAVAVAVTYDDQQQRKAA